MKRTLVLLLTCASVCSAFMAPGQPLLARQPRAAVGMLSVPQSGVATLSMADMTLFSPAKTNLFLRITRKREDGFHELASVFQALGFGDELSFSSLEDSTEDVLTCNVEEVPLDGRNLIVKAFELFRSRTGKKTYFRCDIDKRTPLEGGMGGGSSNAATALWAANRLCGSPATDDELIEWGGELGSDVSFFLSLGTAYCTGRGEIIDNVQPIPTPPGSFWIVKPAEGCPTGQVYGKLGLSPGQDLPGPDPAALRDQMLTDGLSQVTDGLSQT
jgi:4-diphosphocytidyl-2-C-methyl-D-erythritol kinase